MSKRALTLLASMLVTFVLGSVHAFSVFLLPFETLLELPRSQISLIYSFALVAITLAVLIGYRGYNLLPAWALILVTCAVAAAGLWLAAGAVSWWMLFAGYSLAFGFSNGIGYGFSLQLVGRVMPEIKGLAMGAVTAAYAVGSVVFAKIFAWRVALDSVESAFNVIALALLVCGIIAAFMLRLADANYGDSDQVVNRDMPAIDNRKLSQFWFAYMTSVFAGLMAIGHAAGIALARGASVELATLAAIAIGIGSALGGFLAGWLIDRWPARRFLLGLPLVSAIALLVVGAADAAIVVVALLSVVGFSYGAIIAIYPVVISDYFGAAGPRAYGRVFIAWGFAGLVAPWCAGVLYDRYSSYELSMVIAAGVAVLSAASVARFRLGKTA